MAKFSLQALLAAGVLAAAISPASAVPLLSAGYGLNTLNAPYNASVAGSIPVSVEDSLVVTNPYYAKKVTVTGSAEQGRVRAENSVETYALYAQNRSEVVVSFSGQVYLCSSNSPIVATPRSGGFDPYNCIAPATPITSPFPNIEISGSFSASQGSLAVIRLAMRFEGNNVLTAQSDINTSQGDQAGTLRGSGGHLNMSNAPYQMNASSVKFSGELFTLVSCSGPSCTSTISMGDSVNFSESGPAFLGLDPGISVWSPDLNIYDNRWYSPETLAALRTVSVPEPATFAVFGLGLAGLGFAQRRRRTA